MLFRIGEKISLLFEPRKKLVVFGQNKNECRSTGPPATLDAILASFSDHRRACAHSDVRCERKSGSLQSSSSSTSEAPALPLLALPLDLLAPLPLALGLALPPALALVLALALALALAVACFPMLGSSASGAAKNGRMSSACCTGKATCAFSFESKK